MHRRQERHNNNHLLCSGQQTLCIQRGDARACTFHKLSAFFVENCKSSPPRRELIFFLLYLSVCAHHADTKILYDRVLRVFIFSSSCFRACLSLCKRRLCDICFGIICILDSRAKFARIFWGKFTTGTSDQKPLKACVPCRVRVLLLAPAVFVRL